MIPLGDSTPRRSFPIVNYAIIAANGAVFLYELTLSGPRLDAFIQRWGTTPALVVDYVAGGVGSSQVLATLFASMFIHGGWFHILSNMLYLWIFGDNVEDALGHLSYAFFYLAAGLGAAALQILVMPDSLAPAVGASGAIAGVLGAYLVLYPGATVAALIPWLFFIGVVDVPAVILLALWFITQLMSGLASLTESAAGMGGVAWWAHIGGFITGIVLIIMLRPDRRRRNRS